MLYILLRLAILALSVLLTAKIIPGIRVKSFGSAFVFAIVLSIVNFFLGPLLHFIALPLTILTLGLFSLVVNAILWLIADKLVSGVELSGFGAALFGSIITSIINVVLVHFLR